MNIILNGNKEEVAEASTISSLLSALNLDKSLIVTERNGIIIKKEDYDSTILLEDDKVELIRFVGGG